MIEVNFGIEEIEKEAVIKLVEEHQYFIKFGRGLSGALVRKNLEGFYFTDMILCNMRFGSSNLKDSHFRDSNLNGADFTGCDLSSAFFRNARMTRTCFDKAKLSYTEFIGANLYCADFSNCVIDGVNFKGANLSYVDFSNCVINDVNFDFADLQHASFHNAVITNTSLFSVKSLSHANCECAKFDQKSFKHIIKDNIKLKRAIVIYENKEYTIKHWSTVTNVGDERRNISFVTTYCNQAIIFGGWFEGLSEKYLQIVEEMDCREKFKRQYRGVAVLAESFK